MSRSLCVDEVVNGHELAVQGPITPVTLFASQLDNLF